MESQKENKPLRTFEPHEQRYLANLGIKVPSGGLRQRRIERY